MPDGPGADAPPPRPAIDPVYRALLGAAILAGLGWWGWHLGGRGPVGVALAAALPLGGGALWGTFAVPGDPTRGGRAPVPVRGAVRLALEAALIGLAAYGVWTSGSRAAAETLLTAAGLHYALNWERVAWLLRR